MPDEYAITATIRAEASSPITLESLLDDLPGTVTEQGSDYGVILQDHLMTDRDAQIDETNAIQVFRPVDPDGLWGFILQLLGIRISPQGKIIVPLDKGFGPVYWQWFVDVLGRENAERMLVDGNGFFDTASLWGFMCAATGGDLQHITDVINQNGTTYFVCETLDFYTMPERDADGNWYYNGRRVTWEGNPDKFVTRTNRRSTKRLTYMTSGGVNNVSGAVGREHWPKVGNKVAAMQRGKLLQYPALPRIMHVFPESIVVDGELVERGQHYDLLIDALRFRGSNTDIRELRTGKWYKGDEMIPAAPGERGSAFNYRCYVSQEDLKTPWMGNRGYRSPEGW